MRNVDSVNFQFSLGLNKLWEMKTMQGLIQRLERKKKRKKTWTQNLLPEGYAEYTSCECGMRGRVVDVSLCFVGVHHWQALRMLGKWVCEQLHITFCPRPLLMQQSHRKWVSEQLHFTFCPSKKLGSCCQATHFPDLIPAYWLKTLIAPYPK